MIHIFQGFLVAGLLLSDPFNLGLSSKAFADSTLPCPSDRYIKDELYFGLSKPNGRTVTALEWQQFLNREVTPRFTEGLTVLSSYGQYLNRSGKLVIEPSKVLILIYQRSEERERAIADIITTYKTTFNQESVLRVTTCVQATF